MQYTRVIYATMNIDEENAPFKEMHASLWRYNVNKVPLLNLRANHENGQKITILCKDTHVDFNFNRRHFMNFSLLG